MGRTRILTYLFVCTSTRSHFNTSMLLFVYYSVRLCCYFFPTLYAYALRQFSEPTRRLRVAPAPSPPCACAPILYHIYTCCHSYACHGGPNPSLSRRLPHVYQSDRPLTTRASPHHLERRATWTLPCTPAFAIANRRPPGGAKPSTLFLCPSIRPSLRLSILLLFYSSVYL